jgi:hypothetical protein
MMTKKEIEEFSAYIQLKSNKGFLDRLVHFHPTVDEELTPETVQWKELIKNDTNNRRCSRPHAQHSVYCT